MELFPKDLAPIGAHPYMQGILAHSEGRDRTPPDFHPTHRDPWWQRQWLNGWDHMEARSGRQNAP